MKLEDQVIMLDQALRLKELGVTAESLWYWVFPKNNHILSSSSGLHYISHAKEIVHDNEGDEFDHEIVPAYTVAELGIMLPAGYDTMYNTGEGWVGYDRDSERILNPFKTEAECRAAIIIELIQQKEINITECNKILTDKCE